MGSFLRPFCDSCKNSFKPLMLGGGFMNEIPSCKIPCGCYHCGTIVSRDILKPKHKCSRCKRELLPFGKITNEMDFDLDTVFEYNIDFDKSYILENKKYDCPKCKTPNLMFENTGVWD
jgi:hypothetical protein